MGIKFDHRAAVANVGKQGFCLFCHECVVEVNKKYGDAQHKE